MIPFLSFLSKWGLILFSFLFFLLKWVFILFFIFCLSVICITCLVRCILFLWLRPSKDELLHQQVKNGNIEGIEALRSKGAGLEWVDNEGKTPLILACTNPNLYDVAKILIELGANVNAYRPGLFAGTPLHHAARKGLEQTVKLLLSHGANALIINDNCQTPLEVARTEGYINVVRGIEGHLCFFSGWLRRIKVPGFLDLLAPQLFSRKVWVVYLVVPAILENLSIWSLLYMLVNRVQIDEQSSRKDISEVILSRNDSKFLVEQGRKNIGSNSRISSEVCKRDTRAAYAIAETK